MNETWKQISDFTDYEISNMGNVRNIRTKQEPRITINACGYKTAYLKKYRCHRVQFIHRLVARMFIREFLQGEETNHKNCIKTDNRLSNLEICTHAENVEHARINNRWKDTPKPWSYKNRAIRPID
jgi:hypothetical protein